MGTLEAVTSQNQQTSDLKALKTSLFDSDKLVVAGGSFSQVVTTIYNTSHGSFPGLDILRGVISISAMHDARERFPFPQCFTDTYTDIKETIFDWSTQVNQPAILCFTGGPKSGKSAIAHEIAETLSRRGTLAGSFFFEEHKSQDDGHFFLTLAYQIAVNIPGMDHLVNKAVLRDPTILEKRGDMLLAKLILEPLFCIPTLETPFTVVVDEFDRCNTSAVQVEIMRLLSRASLTFGGTLRFLFFGLRDRLDTGISGNKYYRVGRCIPLDKETPLHLSELMDHFFHPYPSSLDTLIEVSHFDRYPSWNQPRQQRSYPNTISNGTLIKLPTDIIGNSAIVPADVQFSGSPMSVDLLRHSPHGMTGSPMVIDSLRSSPGYRGSPMLIDSIYLSQIYDVNSGPTSFYSVHQRLDINATNSTSKSAKEVTEQFRIGSSTYKAIYNDLPVDPPEITVEGQHATDFWQPYTTVGEWYGTGVGESTSGIQNVDDQ